MGLISFPSTINSNVVIPNSLPLSYQSTNFNKISLHKSLPKTCFHVSSPSPFSLQPVIQTRNESSSLVPFDAKSSSGSGEEDNRALETVLKLYSAIKNKDLRELSDIIGDECRCVCNFFLFFQPFQGKKVQYTCKFV